MSIQLREPISAGSHFLGAGLSVAGLVLLLDQSGGDAERIAILAVYGSSLILLFFASALLHGLHCSPRLSACLERLDYVSIFLVIAGTYTPVSLFMVKGLLGWTLLGTQWLLAFSGIYSVVTEPRQNLRALTLTYLCMGWLFLFALGPLINNLTLGQLQQLIAGALIFTIGAIIFVQDRPHPWPGYISAHDLWHVLVLGGTACHFFLIQEVVSSGLSGG